MTAVPGNSRRLLPCLPLSCLDRRPPSCMALWGRMPSASTEPFPVPHASPPTIIGPPPVMGIINALSRLPPIRCSPRPANLYVNLKSAQGSGVPPGFGVVCAGGRAGCFHLLLRPGESAHSQERRRIPLRAHHSSHGRHWPLAALAVGLRQHAQYQTALALLARHCVHRLGEKVEHVEPALPECDLHPSHGVDGLPARMETVQPAGRGLRGLPCFPGLLQHISFWAPVPDQRS